MHRSRLAAVAIDCQVDDLEGAADFWAAALGRPKRRRHGTRYVGLDDRDNQPRAFVQKVTHPSRVHLDIETDDVEAEVARLETLGAKRVEKIEDWWVLEAPTGHRFCVVPPMRGEIPPDANTW